MSAVLINPKSFSSLGGNESATAPVGNLRLDEPGMVWKSANLSTVYLKAQFDGGEWDTVALVGSNLRATDTIRVRAGSTAAIVDGTSSLTVDQTFPAWTGTAPTNGAISFKLLGSPVTSPFVRIDITSTSNPAGFVQAQRLVIGKRLSFEGVNVDAEVTYEDMSSVEDGLGFTTVDRYRTRMGWKVTMEGFTDSYYWANLNPFLMDVGKSKAVVFIPDDSSPHVQPQSVFGRMTSSPKGTSPVADYNRIDLTILNT